MVIGHAVIGSGPPVVLLNGGMMTYASWRPFADRLASRFQVVLCDFRGQLQSLNGPVPADLAGHACDVVDLLDHLGLAKASLLGTSFGGEVALLTASMFGERVRAVVAATVTSRFTEAMTAEVRSLRAACREALAGGSREQMYDLLAASAFSEEYREAHQAGLQARRGATALLPDRWYAGLEQLLVSIDGADLTPYLPRIQCPVLVVAAGQDSVMPLALSEEAARLVPGARLEIVSESGHALIIERPDALLQLTMEFLSSLA